MPWVQPKKEKKKNSLEPIRGDFFFFFWFFGGFLFFLFRATPTAYGSSQVRGQIRAATASLRLSHSNLASKPCLQPTPQLMAMQDP